MADQPRVIVDAKGRVIWTAPVERRPMGFRAPSPTTTTQGVAK